MFTRLAATLCLALAPLLMSVAPAQAATSTLNFKGSFSGGQLGDVTFDFTITRDFSVREFSALNVITTGLTINSITSSVVAGDPFPTTGRGFFGYSYIPDTLRSGDLLDFGTDGAVFEFDTGFNFRIEDISGTPSFLSISDSLATEPFTGEDMESGTTTLTVTDLTAPVPLPASALLLLGALGGTLALKRRKPRAA